MTVSVEDRLIALFWLLADRWGQVGPDGIVVKLPLTYEAVGRFIGARRPTVSLGLRLLNERGALSRLDSGDWRLAMDSLDEIGSVPGAPPLATLLHVRPAPAPPAAPSPDREALMRRIERLREQRREDQRRTTDVPSRNRVVRERLARRRAAWTQGAEDTGARIVPAA